MRSCQTGTSLSAVIAAGLLAGCAEEPLELAPGECVAATSVFRVVLDSPFGEETGPATVGKTDSATMLRFASGFELEISGSLEENLLVGDFIPEGSVYARVSSSVDENRVSLSHDTEVVIWSLVDEEPGTLLLALWQMYDIPNPIESGMLRAFANRSTNAPVQACGTELYEVSLDVETDSWSESIGSGCELRRDGFRFVNLNSWSYADVDNNVCADANPEFFFGWILNENAGR